MIRRRSASEQDRFHPRVQSRGQDQSKKHEAKPDKESLDIIERSEERGDRPAKSFKNHF
jgi:hypothetical protein